MYFRGSGGEAGAHEWGGSIGDLEKTVTLGWQSFFTQIYAQISQNKCLVFI